LTVNQTVQPTVESTVGPVRPTVRSIRKPCKCAITLVGKLPVITAKTACNWRRAVLSADAGLLVTFPMSTIHLRTRFIVDNFIKPSKLKTSFLLTIS